MKAGLEELCSSRKQVKECFFHKEVTISEKDLYVACPVRIPEFFIVLFREPDTPIEEDLPKS